MVNKAPGRALDSQVLSLSAYAIFDDGKVQFRRMLVIMEDLLMRYRNICGHPRRIRNILIARMSIHVA